jgi:hypothetical protein
MLQKTRFNLVAQVKLAFMDDRKTKEMKDEIERQQRLARQNGEHGK